MPNKRSVVINTSPLVALVAALDDFTALGATAWLEIDGFPGAHRNAASPRGDWISRRSRFPHEAQWNFHKRLDPSRSPAGGPQTKWLN